MAARSCLIAALDPHRLREVFAYLVGQAPAPLVVAKP
jgi:hypothetical protein